ncbi:MAG: alanine dehydrogenase, partial [Nitrospirota bacterium]
MIIGVVKEIKDKEFRVGMVPSGVREMTLLGHRVIVQRGAGEGSGIADSEYEKAGAALAGSAKAVYAKAELIVKVKEPLPREYPMLREDQIIFTFLHLAADRGLTEGLMKRGIIGIAYETIQREDGSLPLLMPMSQVAG